MKNIAIFLIISLLYCSGCIFFKNEATYEVSVARALKTAKYIAKKGNYNTTTADIEILKVKKGKEKGPIRLSWLIRFLPREDSAVLLHKEFWIVYFYPKGLLQGNGVLGGGFGVFIELYSGDVILSFADQ